MKRIAAVTVIAVLVLGVSTAVLAHRQGGSMWGGRGGHGSGMMRGGGHGGGMMAMWSHLPDDTLQKLEQMHLAQKQAMLPKRFEMRRARAKLSQALHAYPQDAAGAKAAWEELNNLRKEMFGVRLAMMAQVQQIVGKEAWEQHAMRMSQGRRGSGRMGQGGRGMGQPRR